MQNNQDENLTIDQIVDPSEEVQPQRDDGMAGGFAVLVTILGAIPAFLFLGSATCGMGDSIVSYIIFALPIVGILLSLLMQKNTIRNVLLVVNCIFLLIFIIGANC